MAFSANGWAIKETGLVAGTSGQFRFVRASYITLDAAATVEAAHYFDTNYANMPVGMVFDAVMAAGGTPVLKRYVVTASAATAVVVALQTTTAG